MDIGSVFAASHITHIMEQIDTFPGSIPGVGDPVPGCGVLVLSLIHISNTFIVSSKIDWAPYFEYIVNCVANGEAIAADWCKGIGEGSVVLTELNDAVAAEGTAEAIAEAEEKLVSGELHVFDTTTFTVDGAAVDSYMADVDTDADYTPDTEVISDGYFHESEMRSAPYFDLRIDGITTLNEMRCV